MTPLTPAQVDELLRAAGQGSVIYFVGIGGCGMSGLAHLALDLGFSVAGSDLVASSEVQQLRQRGAQIHLGHFAEQLRLANPALVVYSSAIRFENPELAAARDLQRPIARRAVLLAALMRRQRGICVAGMHGKTTTTALLAFALERLGAPPSFAIGALVPQLERHARFTALERGQLARTAGPDDISKDSREQAARAPGAMFFVAETDESDGTLREFQPEHAIVLNVDDEHLDYFANFEAIGREFQQFAAQVKDKLVFCADDARLSELFSRRPRAVSYGFNPLAEYCCSLLPQNSASGTGILPVQWSATRPPAVLNSSDTKLDRRDACPTAAAAFEVWHHGAKLGEFTLALLGEKNVSNATAVIALLHQLGFAAADIAAAIAPFRGAARRQQEIFRDARFRVFDDYGHHPNEVSATIAALKNLSVRRLLVAFQPHRFTRTQHLLNQFATCFRGADKLWVADVYAASEEKIPGVDGALLAEAIRAHGQAVEFVPQLESLSRTVRTAMQPGDLVLFLGAGDITRAAHRLAAQLTEEPPMNNESLHAELAALLAPTTVLRRDESLAKRTTLRVGGSADFYAEPATEAELAALLKFCSARRVPFLMLGRGSNLLVRDGGVRGVVICLAHANFSRIEVLGERLHCGAGAPLKLAAMEAKRHGLGGLEFLEGIPGNVGGALRMNAGAMGGAMFDAVESFRFMDYCGQIFERRAAEVNVEYRGCPLLKNHVALGAVLTGVSCETRLIEERLSASNEKRWSSQPRKPSAGCIFKNPVAVPAGKLIDELGLKGARVGGAVVSGEHGNFIVNDGGATARDVLDLIEVIRETARRERGIELHTEVEIIGEP
ncbi:MAG: UDP-N-acetylmuramate dehydrogenase [Verrucomicrobia bacterium]|nr:UDP-N-acetylmuramate dehydrogenase [Verrucomicrobiota bacterium]